MDAYIATIISEYLPLHFSNVFLSMLGLTEHVITPAMAVNLSHNRQAEVIRALDYPPQLIIQTDNYQAGIECLVIDDVSEVIDMFTDFDRLAMYLKDHFNVVAKIIDRDYRLFVEYIKQVHLDVRYVDFVGYLDEAAIKRHLIAAKKSSMNYHLIAPSLENLVRTVQRMRAAPGSYTACRYNNNCLVMYDPYLNMQSWHHDIFRYNYMKFIDNKDQLATFARETFEDVATYRQWIDRRRDAIPMHHVTILRSMADNF